MSSSKYGKGLITLKEGTEKLGVSWGTVAVPDHEFSDRQYAGVHPPVVYRTLPLIDIVHQPGSAREGQLSGHLLVEAGVTVVTAVHLNVMGPRGRLTVKRQPVQDFETFRGLLDKRTAELRAGGGDLFKAFEVQACVSVVTQVISNVIEPRGLPTADYGEAQDFKAFCDLLARVHGLPAARLVRAPMDETGNASMGKNEPADDPASIDPTKVDARLAICDQVELVAKPMTAVNAYSSTRNTPDLATNLATMSASVPAPRLKVAAQFVGALILIVLISTFALGMIAAVRNLLVVVISSSVLHLRSVSCAMPVTRFDISCAHAYRRRR
eukprot:SAG31_NODE_4993_length_2814_cov_3.680663_1_plen_326_part_00